MTPFHTTESVQTLKIAPESGVSRGALRVRFCLELYATRIAEKRHFLHEHPWGASSWKLKCIQDLLKLPNVRLACGDQCPFGQGQMAKGWLDRHDFMLARKRTGWLTNVEEIADAVAVKCCNDNPQCPPHKRHEHVQLRS